MCGFLAWFSNGETQTARPDHDRLGQVLKLIEHRGPDDESTEGEADWWMGFRRLAILDLSEAGRQPMAFDSERYFLTFNGEIYNFQELREELGDDLPSTGDSIVLGSWLAKRGPAETLPKLRGMFGFAWYDRQDRKVVAARDPYGIKPLYYYELPEGGIVLSSEIKPLCHLLNDHGALDVNAEVLQDYFRWGSIQAPDSILKGVKSLLPGQYLEWDADTGTLKIDRYYLPKWEPKENWWDTPERCLEETRNRVMESVKAHLIAEVPVGVFLSGGLDSSIMAACMKELGIPEIEAFSVGYEGDAGLEDESSAAAKTAKFLGAEFTVERVSAKSLESHFDHYIGHLDQPSGDALNTYLVSRIASEKVTVALSGLGADEWLAGYNGHRMMDVAHRFPMWKMGLGGALNGGLGPLLKALPASIQGHKATKLFRYVSGMDGHGIREMHATGRSIFAPDDITDLLGEGLVDDRVTAMPGWWDDELLEAQAPDTWLNKLLFLETHTFLQNTLLRDNDSVSMAHSIELRVPLVDPEVFQLSAMLPPDQKITPAGGKRVLREAFKDILPEWIYDDRQKKTFTLPLMKWLRTPVWDARVMDTLTSQRCRDRGWLRPEAVERHLKAYRSANVDSKAGWKLSQTVWLMFVLESWAVSHLDDVG